MPKTVFYDNISVVHASDTQNLPIDFVKHNKFYRELAEWSKAHDWKSCERETVPRVQIPHSLPLGNCTNTRLEGFVLFLTYECFGVCLPIKDILPKPPIQTHWQNQIRNEYGIFRKSL